MSSLVGPKLGPTHIIQHLAPLRAAKSRLAQKRRKQTKLPGPRLHCTSGVEADRQVAASKAKKKKKRNFAKPRSFRCKGCKKYPFGEDALVLPKDIKRHGASCEPFQEWMKKVRKCEKELVAKEKSRKKPSRRKFLATNEIYERSDENMEHKKMSDKACKVKVLKPLPRKKRKRKRSTKQNRRVKKPKSK